MWKEMMLIWRVGYSCMQRGWRCALARRERSRREEYQRLLERRLEVKVRQRLDRIKWLCFRALEGALVHRGVRKWRGVEDVEGGALEEREGSDDVEEGGGEEKEDDGGRVLPTITLASHHAPMSTLMYTPLSGSRQSVTHMVNKHTKSSTSGVLSVGCDAESRGYYKARNMVSKVGVFEWDRRVSNDLTVNDRGCLFKAAR